MKTGNPKRLVIDANVARASGGVATHPQAKHCRDFLQEMLSLGHSVVMTPEISSEWNRRQSPFALRWRVLMATSNKVCSANSPVDKDLRKKIKEAAEEKNQIPVMRKDFHLLEAARVSDQTIISLERRVRRHFAYAAQHVDELRDIVWVNPDRTEEEPLVWLQNGAPPEECRKLRTWEVA